MHLGNQHSRRRGLTLIELIVVIAIIVLVAALAAAFMPRVQDRQNINRGMDLLSQWLLTAKQRAKRDNRVTGILFTTNPNDLNAGNYPNMYSQAVTVQQPGPLSGGQCNSVTANGDGTYTALFQGVDFSNGGNVPQSEWLVQPGDFFELGVGPPYTWHFVASAPAGNQLLLLSGAPSATATSNYLILRMPRPLAGEPVLEMPGTVMVDLGSSRPSGLTQILFAPNGSVTYAPNGSGTGGVGGGKIVFWVKDPTSPDPSLGGLVAVQTQTGFIATYDIGPPGSEFVYADAGRDEGF